MSKQSNEEKLYSYHTFIFPFIWNQNGKVTRKQFEKCMHPAWEPDFREDSKRKPEEKENASGKDAKKKLAYDPLLYGQYCYFNPAARNVIFMEEGDKNPIVRNFRFNLEKLGKVKNWLHSVKGPNNPVRYVIQKGDFR